MKEVIDCAKSRHIKYEIINLRQEKMKEKIKRPMSLMVRKLNQNHKIAIRLSLLMVFCLSFLSVYIFRSLLNDNTPAATGYMAAAGAIIVGLSVAFASDRNSFASSAKRLDDRAAESIQSATYLYIIINDLRKRINIVKEQAKKQMLRNDLSKYILEIYNCIFEVSIYKTIQGEKIGEICALAENVHDLCELINIPIAGGRYKRISQERIDKIITVSDDLDRKLEQLNEKVKEFRFSLDLGDDY